MCCFQIIHKCFLLTFCFLLCLWEATFFCFSYKAYLWDVLRCVDSCCLCATTLSPPSHMTSYHESCHIFTLSQMQLGVVEHCSSQIALSRLRCTFVMSNPYFIMLPLIWVKQQKKENQNPDTAVFQVTVSAKFVVSLSFTLSFPSITCKLI